MVTFLGLQSKRWQTVSYSDEVSPSPIPRTKENERNLHTSQTKKIDPNFESIQPDRIRESQEILDKRLKSEENFEGNGEI